MDDKAFNMNSGTELDLLIATKVMGWTFWNMDDDYSGEFPMVSVDEYGVMLYLKHGDMSNYFAPSTNMKDAWTVVEFLTEDGFCPGLLFDDNAHWALATDGAQNVVFGDEPEDISTAFFVDKKMWCDTAELAICRTALFYFL